MVIAVAYTLRVAWNQSSQVVRILEECTKKRHRIVLEQVSLGSERKGEGRYVRWSSCLRWEEKERKRDGSCELIMVDVRTRLTYVAANTIANTCVCASIRPGHDRSD